MICVALIIYTFKRTLKLLTSCFCFFLTATCPTYFYDAWCGGSALHTLVTTVYVHSIKKKTAVRNVSGQSVYLLRCVVINGLIKFRFKA